MLKIRYRLGQIPSGTVLPDITEVEEGTSPAEMRAINALSPTQFPSLETTRTSGTPIVGPGASATAALLTAAALQRQPPPVSIPKTDYMPYILGGVALLAVVMLASK